MQARPSLVFVNLTCGLDAVRGSFDGFVRIQSTALEQHRWGSVLRDLDYTFLAALAQGADVCVIDASHNPGKWGSRAIWQGLPFINYVIGRRWHGYVPDKLFFRDHNARRYVDGVYEKLPRADLAHIDYFARLNPSADYQLSGFTAYTEHDGQPAYWAELFRAIRPHGTLSQAAARGHWTPPMEAPSDWDGLHSSTTGSTATAGGPSTVGVGAAGRMPD